jgi:hypothetical protein
MHGETVKMFTSLFFNKIPHNPVNPFKFQTIALFLNVHLLILTYTFGNSPWNQQKLQHRYSESTT